MSAPNLIEAFHETATRLGDSPALRYGGTTDSWAQLRERVAAVAGGLLALGARRGDRVALLLGNGPDLIPCDLGAITAGSVPFSVYHTLPAERMAEILAHAQPTVVIAEASFLDRLEQVRGGLPSIRHVVITNADGALTLGDIEARGRGFDDTSAAMDIAPEDPLTLIYTSGTTGSPKAVPLTHRNVLSHIEAVAEVIRFPETGARVISWLPPAHIAERMSSYYQPIARGGEIVICPDPKTIVEWLPQAPPQWFLAIPRVWEKLEARGREWLARQESNGAGTLAELRRYLGLDQLIAAFSGAAPISESVLEFMHAIGVPVGEMYGMSEAGGSVTFAAPDKIKIGSVGPPIPGIELRLAEDGEVLLRGEAIVDGYWESPEETGRSFDADGWFASGDLGALDDDGFLTIVGRKKELIINSSGKNMSPTMIESRLKAQSLVIAHCVAIGDRRPYNVALIVLDPPAALAWAAQHGLEGSSIAALASDDTLIRYIQSAVDGANEHLARVEQIRKFKVLSTAWEPGDEELTPTSKPRRHVIEQLHADAIAGLYRA